MATLMPLCAGLVGPKSENVEIDFASRFPPRPFGARYLRCHCIKDASCRFGELCFLLGQGAHFCKNGEQIWPESEKCTQKTLDGEFDAYVCGLGGAEK